MQITVTAIGIARLTTITELEPLSYGFIGITGELLLSSVLLLVF